MGGPQSQVEKRGLNKEARTSESPPPTPPELTDLRGVHSDRAGPRVPQEPWKDTARMRRPWRGSDAEKGLDVRLVGPSPGQKAERVRRAEAPAFWLRLRESGKPGTLRVGLQILLFTRPPSF